MLIKQNVFTVFNDCYRSIGQLNICRTLYGFFQSCLLGSITIFVIMA